ncbi:MAG TPA: hypothetical protein VF381_11140 [Thermoanaerobaculia bacterium]
MRSAAAALLCALLVSCSNEKPAAAVSKDPISVRGWIADVDTGAPSDRFRTVETESARRTAAFQAMNVWVDGAPYASGGVAENGSFIFLDVPPGKTAIGFSTTGVPQAMLTLENVPPNADIFVPDLVMTPKGMTVADPKAIRVRVAAKIGKPAPSGLTARIVGIDVPVMNVPINSMIDRHDYPTPPSTTPVPIAKVH